MASCGITQVAFLHLYRRYKLECRPRKENVVKERIIKALASYHEEISQFTQKLVAIPTENPPGTSYRECIEAISAKLRELEISHRIHEVREPEGKGSRRGGHDALYPRFWIQGFYGEGVRTLYFHGHYDVVPASSEEQFNPYLKDGILSGRGTADMKGGLAAMIYAVRVLRDCDVTLDGRIGLSIVPDEETGGRLGSRSISDAGLLGKDGIGMLMPECTSGVIWNANRGAISLRVRVKGKPAHVGLHYEGINAFERMIKVAQALLCLKGEIESRKTEFRIEPEEARRSILMLGGQCRGGTSFNLVPAECAFTVERRINPEEDLATEKKRLFDLFDGLRDEGIELEVEVLQEGSSAGISEQSPIARALAESIEQVTGKPANFEMCPGLCEIRFYAEKGIPAFAYGPGLLSVAHGPNEYVSLNDIYACAAVYALTAIGTLGTK